MTVAVGSDALAQDIIKSTAIYATAGGSANAYTVGLPTAPDAYTTGMVIVFKANHTITGSATVNVNSLGAKTLKKNISVNLEAGDITNGETIVAVYDGTNFQVVGKARRRIEVAVFCWGAATGANGATVYTHTGDTNYHSVLGGTFQWNPDNFDADVTFRLEVMGGTTDGTANTRIALYDDTGVAVITERTGLTNAAGTTFSVGSAVAKGSLPAAQGNLSIRLKVDDSGKTGIISGARVVAIVPI